MPNEITNQAGGRATVAKAILEKRLKECLNLSVTLAAFARMERNKLCVVFGRRMHVNGVPKSCHESVPGLTRVAVDPRPI